METKSICILANSIKFAGRCIAGMVVEHAEENKWKFSQIWVRPLSHRKGGELRPEESELNTGKQPAILDIIDIPLEAEASVDGQPEDWLIQPESAWLYRGRFALKVLEKLTQNPDDLWLEFTYRSDRVSPEYLRSKSLPSLYLIRPSNLEIVITEFSDGSGRSKKKRRAQFYYKGVRYDLALTDPLMQQRYFPDFPQTKVGRLENGPRSDSIICVSLAPEFNGYHYKLVASIIELS